MTLDAKTLAQHQAWADSRDFSEECAALIAEVESLRSEVAALRFDKDDLQAATELLSRPPVLPASSLSGAVAFLRARHAELDDARAEVEILRKSSAEFYALAKPYENENGIRNYRAIRAEKEVERLRTGVEDLVAAWRRESTKASRDEAANAYDECADGLAALLKGRP